MKHKRSRRSRKKPPRIRRRTAPGAGPGVVCVPAEAARPRIQVIKYSATELIEEEITDAAQVRRYLDDAAVTWINVDGLGDAATLTRLAEIFGLHELAMEDVVNVHQRAKVEEYEQHLFIVIRMVTVKEHVHSEQLSIFLGQHFVVTFLEDPGDCLDPVRQRLRQSRGRLRQAGADYLVYALIDAVIDAYFPVVDEFGERMELLDAEVSSGHAPGLMASLHDVRGDLLLLRRIVRPLRDALVRLMPDPHALFSEETQFHLRDCYDHTVQLMDLLDTYREMCSDLRDFYLSTVSNRLNEIMKVLTIISTIFIPLSFIAGVYGMNFNTALPGNMPELNWPYGYVYAWALMLLVATGLLIFIWKRRWLSDGSERPSSNGSS